MIFENFVAFMQKVMFFTAYVNNSSSFPKPLTQAEEQMYVEKFLAGDEKAKDILIHHNLRLVAHIVKKYDTGLNNSDDLISIGTIGLIKGIDSFKHDKNIKLTTYAAKCMQNAIVTLRL